MAPATTASLTIAQAAGDRLRFGRNCSVACSAASSAGDLDDLVLLAADQLMLAAPQQDVGARHAVALGGR